MDKDQLSQKFINFAVNECKGSSKLYEFLSLKIAEDDEILDLCMNARDGQPIPNLLFAAVHYLLLKGKEHVLREYYQSIVVSHQEVDASFAEFKDFCTVFRDEISSILKSKIVQTNEVRRCAYLYPSFCYIFNMVNKPLSLIEIGTSAGLQLLWDTYRYSYGNNQVYGNKQSNVHIRSEIIGDNPPFILTNSPPVVSRLGLDLHISDLRDPDDYLWLKSLIWPEHQERLELFEHAALNFKKDPVSLIEGDGVMLLSDIVEHTPKDSVLCIFHTHVANQFPENLKYKLLESIKLIGSKRDVFHLYNNMWDRKLHLDSFINGIEYHKTVGETEGHGRWFKWEL